MSTGPRPTSSKCHLDPSSRFCATDKGRRLGTAVALSGGDGSSSNTMRAGPRHWAEYWGSVPLWDGGSVAPFHRGSWIPTNTMRSGQRLYLHTKWHLDPSNVSDRIDRQRSDRVHVLQTVVQKVIDSISFAAYSHGHLSCRLYSYKRL